MYYLNKTNQQFSEEQVALVKERIAEADLCEEPGLTWEQVKKTLRKKCIRFQLDLWQLQIFGRQDKYCFI